MRRTLTVLLPMLLVLSRLLPAQSVSGSLRADVDNRAIAGAVVLLLGVPSDSVLGRTTTFIDGRFVVRAPRAGRFVLRILRLGQRPFTLPAFELADGEVKRIALTLTRQPIELVAFNVRSDAVCRRAPDSLAGRSVAYGGEDGVAIELVDNVRRRVGRRLHDVLPRRRPARPHVDSRSCVLSFTPH